MLKSVGKLVNEKKSQHKKEQRGRSVTARRLRKDVTFGREKGKHWGKDGKVGKA